MTQNIIQEQKDAARVIVEQQVSCYTSYLFTNDPEYLTAHGSMEPMYEQQGAKQQPPPAVEDPTAAERTMQQVKDGSKAAYQSVQGFLNSGQKNNEKRHLRYS